MELTFLDQKHEGIKKVSERKERVSATGESQGKIKKLSWQLQRREKQACARKVSKRQVKNIQKEKMIKSTFDDNDYSDNEEDKGKPKGKIEKLFQNIQQRENEICALCQEFILSSMYWQMALRKVSSMSNMSTIQKNQ